LTPQAQYVFTAAAGQTVWTPPAGVTFVPGIAQVFVNGVRWNRSESYDDSTGTQITFTNGLTMGWTISVLLSLTALYPVTGVYSADTVGFLGANGNATNVSALASVAASKGASLVAFQPSGTGAVARTVQDKLLEVAKSLEDFGAVGDGVTDCYAAYQLAIASGATRIALHSKTYYFSQGITVPNGIVVEGTVMMESLVTGGALGTVLLFANSTPVCVTLNGTVGGTGGGVMGLRRLSVTRSGVPPSSADGVLVRGACNSFLEDVYAYNHQVNYHFLGHGANPDPTTFNAITCNVRGLYSSRAYDTHFVVESWPELRVTGGRAGMGATDVAGNAFIKVTSPTGGTGGTGPNTIIFTNYQFNQGTAGPTNWLSFVNNQAAAGNQVIFQFTNCHIENITGAYIASDALSTFLQKLTLTGCSFNTAVPMFALNSGTKISGVKFSNCDISASTFTPSVNYINTMQVTGCNFGGCTAVFNAPTSNNWCVAFAGNTWGGASSLTLQGSGWAEGSFLDSFSFDSTFSDTTGSKNLQYLHANQAMKAWTPGVSFGGNSVGVTYSNQQGYYQVVGREVRCYFVMTLTSKGTSTGAAKITGLPFLPMSGVGLSGVGPTYCTGLTSIVGPLITSVAGGTQTTNLFMGSSTGIVGVADTNFTNTTTIGGSFSYLI
jgi:hypothetical protein